jgi:surface antigen
MLLYPAIARSGGSRGTHLESNVSRSDNVVGIAVNVTSAPDVACIGIAELQSKKLTLPPLVTGSGGEGRWSWQIAPGVPTGRWSITAQCSHPDVQTATTSFVADGVSAEASRTTGQLYTGVLHAGPVGHRSGGGNGESGASLYPYGQCTWYVAIRRPDLPYFRGKSGDALHWIASAKRAQLPTGTTPRVGAVAVFLPEQYGARRFGYVAYVETVEGSKITIAEAHYRGRPPGSKRRIGWAGLHFIYLPPSPEDPLGSNSSSSPTGPSLVTQVIVPGVMTPTPSPKIWPPIDLLTEADTRFDGSWELGWAGLRVANAGDVNGDGIDDFIVGSRGADNNGREDSGSAYVVFGGKTLPGLVDLQNLGPGGFRIDGTSTAGWAGEAVSGAGDVNGDGLADVIVGSRGTDFKGEESGSAYVVFGKKNSATVDLAALGGHGFSIYGAGAGDQAGWSVSGAGDVNGDGLDDVIVGAPFASGLRTKGGTAYVIFGRRGAGADIDLANLGEDGFEIDGLAGSWAGESVAAAGDVNKDGLSDVIVGAPLGDARGRELAGTANVVFGKANTEAVDLGQMLGGGYTIEGARTGDGAGWSVAGGGDINGDGRPDIIVGAATSSNNAREGSGSVYVVWGKADTADVELNLLEAGGFRIDGPAYNAQVGTSVSALPDFNGDGRPDLIVGAVNLEFDGRVESGGAYIVFGKRDDNVIDLNDLGPQGVNIGGAAAGDSAGVVATGDFSGDGRPDILIGAGGSHASGLRKSGAIYLVLGKGGT